MYLLWPLSVLFLLTLGVFVTTRDPLYITHGITSTDSALAVILLAIFVIVFTVGIRIFFHKKNTF